MKTNIKTSIIAQILILFIFLSSCEYKGSDVEDGSYTFFDIETELQTKIDYDGNLQINNTTNFRLYLYVNDSIFRLIPANNSYYLVNIPTSGGQAINLKLFEKTSLEKKELRNPPSQKVFRQWNVVLPENTWQNTRVVWEVKEVDGGTDKADVNFTYPSIDGDGNMNKYVVDVFLNSKSGTKLTSINPGGDISIKLDYGYQVLLFRYWIDNGTSGILEKGWVEKKPNGVSYGLVLNSFSKKSEFDIPTYFERYPQETGTIDIDNNTETTVYIKANGQLLENFIILEEGESTDGMSYIAGGAKNNKLTLPIGTYKFVAIIPESGAEVYSTTLKIELNKKTELIIE